MNAVQITGVNADELFRELNKDREKIVKATLAKQETPIDFPAEDIMKMFGWKTKRKFYKERQVRGVEPVRIIGSTPTYIPAHFLRNNVR